jgi:hypothetical protein
MKKVTKEEITNTHSAYDPLFLSYEGKLVGMIKLSDFNQWYPVFVNRSFGYDAGSGKSIADPANIKSLHITDIIDWATSNGFEIYSN